MHSLTLPALLIGCVMLSACAPAATQTAQSPVDEPITWRDSDGCWRELPRPGQAINLNREVDENGTVICPNLGPEAVTLAAPPEATLPAPMAASVPEVIPAQEPVVVATSTPTPTEAIVPALTVASQPEVQPQSLPPRARPNTPEPTQTAQTASPGPTGMFVQVGAFGDPANVTRNKRNFETAGIPVVTREARGGGRTLTLLQLGPFPSAESAETARDIARAAGFSDAYIVTVQ